MSKTPEMDNLNIAYDYINETIALLAENDRYDNIGRYQEILDKSLNDLNTVIGSMKIEELLIEKPNMADMVIE